MIVRPIKTGRISPGEISLTGFLDKYVTEVKEGSVAAITSKVVSICEGSVVPANAADKEKLAVEQSELYLEPETSIYHHHFTIARGTLLGMGGVDESNGGGYYVLLPKDPRASANLVRRHLRRKLGIKNLGVIITDSISIPLRLGAVGACLSYSGFTAVKDYRGQPDLFGRPLKISQANIAAGLASAAVLAMGEGAEQTPIAIFEDVPFVEFQAENPTDAELKAVNLSLDDDLFAPFLKNAPWRKGGRAKT